MSTLNIQDLNYDKSTTKTVEPSEAASIYGGFYGPNGFTGKTAASNGKIYGPNGFTGKTINKNGNIFDGNGNFTGKTLDFGTRLIFGPNGSTGVTVSPGGSALG